MKLTERKKLAVYKVLLFVFAFVLAFMPSTISRNLEVNSRVIVEMIGLDGGENIEVTAQYVTPSEAENSTKKDNVTVKAETLTEAMDMLNTALGRRAEIGHCSVVVVGEDVKPEVLGTLMTSTDITADVYLTAAQGKASKLVGDMTDFMNKTGVTDADFIAYSAKQAHVATITLLNFLSDLGSASKTSFMPLAELLDSGDGGSGGQGSEQGGSQGGGEQSGGQGGEQGGSGGGQSETGGLMVEKLALYSPDGRAGVLEKEAARGVAWVSSPIEKSVVTAKIDEGDETVDVTGRMRRKKSSIDIRPENSHATVKLKTTIEPHGDGYNKLGKDGYNAIDKVKIGFEETIRKEISAAYTEAKKLRCDPLFIGREFYRYAPDFYENMYSADTVGVDFAVEVILK